MGGYSSWPISAQAYHYDILIILSCLLLLFIYRCGWCRCSIHFTSRWVSPTVRSYRKAKQIVTVIVGGKRGRTAKFMIILARTAIKYPPSGLAISHWF